MAQTATTSLPTIGDVIRAWRIFHGLSSTELSEKAGVRSQYLSEIEHNRTANPKQEKLEKLAVALEVPLQDILGRRLPLEKAEVDDGQAKEGEKQATSTPISIMANPSLALTDSLLDAAWEQIEALIEPAHLSDEQMKKLGAVFIGMTPYLLELIKTEPEK
jgi:transcriptional regulator with XRE-family HTH domain